MFADPIEAKRHLGHFFIAIDISAFQEVEFFQDRISELMTILRSQDSSSDIPVMVSGDPEKISFEDRIKNGIPVKEKDWEEFDKIAKLYDIPLEL